jgi:hypothetical protein
MVAAHRWSLPAAAEISLSGIFFLRGSPDQRFSQREPSPSSSRLSDQSPLSDQVLEGPFRPGADVAAHLVGAGLRDAPVAPDQRIIGEGKGKAVDELREAPLPLAKAPVRLVEPPFYDQILRGAGDLEISVLKPPDWPA